MRDTATARRDHLEDGNTENIGYVREVGPRMLPASIWHRRVETQAMKPRRSPSKAKTHKNSSLLLEGGAADARALAWEAATAKACAAAAADANLTNTCTAGGKRTRTESRPVRTHP